MRFIATVGGILLILAACKVEQPQITSDSEFSVPTDSLTEEDTIIKSAEYPVYRASRTRLMDLIHTKLEISLDWDKQRLNGVATLHLRPYFYPQDKVILDAKNFDIDRVQLIHGTLKKDLDYFNSGVHLYISLDSLYARNEDIFIEIKYTARPTERITEGSRAIESDQGLYFVNPQGKDKYKPTQVWTQGETEANSCWFPTIDSPNERTTQEIFLTVDNRYRTLSNGELVYSKFNGDSTRTDYWKLDLPHAPYLFMIAVGEFEVYEESWRDIPLTYYMEKEYSEYAKDIFGATPEMMDFFSRLYGMDYVWPKYAQVVVRDFVSGAMENTTATVFYDDLNVDRRELIDYNFEKIIAHELAHQWFGDLVTCESWANLTLNEGFANYAEYLWYEYKYGSYEADLHAMDELDQYLEEAGNKQVDLIRFYYSDREDMFDSHSYAKGGLVLNMLRDYVGDEAFFTALYLYLEQHKFSSVEVHDLRLAFEEVTGEDLNWFFNQWFLASGHPILEIEHNFTDTTLAITVAQKQDLNSTPLYRIPVSVDLFSDSGIDSYLINVDRPQQTFEFRLEARPKLVLFDGSQKLLAEISHHKALEEFVYQFSNSDKFLARFRALDTLLNCRDDSLKSAMIDLALNDDFWYFRQMGINHIGDLKQELQNRHIAGLVEVATGDPKSEVRADALHMLYSLTGEGYLDVYRNAIDDSSYMVSGSALYLYSDLRPEEFGNISRRFEDIDNINIVVPLASFYIDASVPDKYNWFIEKMQRAQSGSLWYLLQYFGEYMMSAPELTKRKSIVVLEEYARNHGKAYVRLAAYQALGLLSDLSGVDTLREDIKNKENDTYLKQLYQSLL